MRVIKAEEGAGLSSSVPEQEGVLQPHWLEGPFNADRLDVGIVTLSPGGAAPPHVHVGGQVIVATAGRGFVETGGERVELGPGDIVITPPGELHTHGALDGESFAHLTVTTGGYAFPSA